MQTAISMKAAGRMEKCMAMVLPSLILGVFTYSNGDNFKGTWEDDKRTGKGGFPSDSVGVYTYANGDTYVGDWKDDKKNGQGRSSGTNL